MKKSIQKTYIMCVSNEQKLRTGRTALALAAVILVALLAVACTRDAAKPANEGAAPVAVQTVRAEAKPLDEALEITGSLVSSVGVDVKTEFAGRVESVFKQEGERVSKGERIAQLDDQNARLTVAQSGANLEVAQAALDRAKVAEDHTNNELERSKNLLKSGGVTDRDFQAAHVAARDAHAQVKLAEAQIAQARDAVAVSEKHLSDCRIVSPIAGEVERKYFNPGSWVDGNVLLYRLVDNQRLELQAYVASSELARVRKGERIRLSVAAYPDQIFEAAIQTLSAAVDAQNRSVLVRASVPNAGNKLKSGMFVKGKIITGTNPSAIVVPSAAVWRRVGQEPFVYVVEQSIARRRTVSTGQEELQDIEITRGLNPGDQVVAEQNLELAEGVRVTPRS